MKWKLNLFFWLEKTSVSFRVNLILKTLLLNFNIPKASVLQNVIIFVSFQFFQVILPQIVDKKMYQRNYKTRKIFRFLGSSRCRFLASMCAGLTVSERNKSKVCIDASCFFEVGLAQCLLHSDIRFEYNVSLEIVSRTKVDSEVGCVLKNVSIYTKSAGNNYSDCPFCPENWKIQFPNIKKHVKKASLTYLVWEKKQNCFQKIEEFIFFYH